MTLKETRQAFRELVEKSGRSNMEYVIREFNRERVNPEREKRIKCSKSEKVRLFNKQVGRCPICNLALDVPIDRNEADHKDPNRADFNHRTNIQLVHWGCNRKKSSKSLIDQSKETGKTIMELQ